ncbi:prepilin peptidase [Cupriavidus basilensis]|uniref:Prepilin peptidase n=1 Tax=Cupriavidus basilensis TaxID=68895 RepID=A0ABT6AWJ7_9BURK|nr:prepilin peptidase [Cupriavidus basilensis]MDF3837000.1 prepilin peptidase [Cupriavidus basilensis]
MGSIAALFCAVTIWTDLAYRKVPNAVLAATLAAVCMVLLFGHVPEPGLASRLLGFVIGLLVMLPFYALGRMGAGDVKFFAVTGLFTGPVGLVTVWVVGSLLACAHALLASAQAGTVRAAWRDRIAGLLRRQAVATAPAAMAQMAQARGIPYAAYLAVGLLVWMVSGR